MKRRLLELIVCPHCREEFSLDFFSGEKSGEIKEGRLLCEGCGRLFPIIGGVPRLLPDPLKDLVLVHHGFFGKYGSQFPEDYFGQMSKDSHVSIQMKKTSSSFGFEWTTFSKFYKQWEDNFKGYIRPLTPSFFGKKLGLDVGCGTGRHLYFAAQYGAEVVGIDLSEAVQVAHTNTVSFFNAHVVQADLYYLPFRTKYFDFIYSFGVLHHLPEPEAGFKELLHFLKPNGHISIYLYNSYLRENKIKYYLLKIASVLRLITTRLPLKLLYWLCYPLALVIYFFVVLPYRILQFLPKGQEMAECLPFGAYRRYPVGVLHNDLFDRFSAPIENRYTRMEVEKWFERSGLKNVQIAENYGWVGHGDNAG